MRKKKNIYWCVTTNGIEWVCSSSTIDPLNKNQVDWLSRQVEGEIFLAIGLGEPKTGNPMWDIPPNTLESFALKLLKRDILSTEIYNLKSEVLQSIEFVETLTLH